MEAHNVEHLCNHSQLTNITYDFGNMEFDNVEHLCNCGDAHTCYLYCNFRNMEAGNFESELGLRISDKKIIPRKTE